ncbi:MAG: WecB/TagA/CpsF family glycosyltransferase [Oscillospiraceae bacterium]|jgi:N-acetylglucosaminyldiphosphoundecaprenol N-acetyl-beta-D-mannosaminyltransferase|nr:WecB/TagA/CpsF family glycosyltransferase [Oscillospiraceae bacterium]
MPRDCRADILGVSFDRLTREGAAEAALSIISARGAAGGDAPYIVTPNPEIVWSARADPALRKAIASAALVLPDGVGITLAARILRMPPMERATGIDVAGLVFARLAGAGGSVYLLGARPGVAERAGARLAEAHPGLVIAGARDGYFEDSAPVLADIAAAAPDFLLICLGSPKQELWAYENRGRIGARLAACLGGALDVFSGDVRRAPPVFRKLGLEWLHRLLREPRRARRMAALPKFILAAARERVSRGGRKGGGVRNG